MVLAPSNQFENELLLGCARTALDSDMTGRVRGLLQRNINWEYLKKTAHAHGVLPLLYRSLSAVCPEAVPRPILDDLQRRFHLNDFQKRFMSKELIKVLDVLERHEIPAIPYKGPTLAVMAYGSLALRRFGDLDILIPERELFRTRELLTSQGYELNRGSAETSYIENNYDYLFTNHDGRVHLEIHWAFTRKHWPFPIDLNRLWRRVEPVQLDGKTVSSFHPEDLLLILCVHGAKHYWERLGWICDIAELARVNKKIDWKRVTEQAVELRSNRPLLLGLDLARKLLGAGLPEEVLQKINADPAIKSISAHVRDCLFPRDKSPIMTLKKDFSHIRLRESWRDRVIMFLYIIRGYLRQRIKPNTKDEAALRLPGSLYWAYYLIRPIRLIKECVMNPVRSVRK